MKSSGIFLITIQRLKQVKNDLKLKIFSLLYFFRALNVFEHRLTSAKMFIFKVFFIFFFLSIKVYKQSGHKLLLNLFINNQASPQAFAQSVHKQSRPAQKRLLNLFINQGQLKSVCSICS